MLAKKAEYVYDANFIEAFAHGCVLRAEETLLRVLYYDCAPDQGSVNRPISGEKYEFKGSDGWLKQLAAKDLIAVRRGVLKFRGWVPKKVPIATAPRDEDFRPDFEQKGVDMRIGLDVATYASNRAVDRIALVTGDTDCVPAMKHARIAGMQLILIALPNSRTPAELRWHSDFERVVPWPVNASKMKK